MAQIYISELTFGYENSYDNIFENVSFSIDSNWKLGFIGRNGKGKSTFLNLLLGKYEYQGNISTSAVFDYFPYPIDTAQMKENTIDIVESVHPDYELWKICRELELLKIDSGILYRPYETLSHGERTKVMLAVLFSRDNYFLLIDEPTNHLDVPARELVKDYLNTKKGFILVSHDRSLLDACVDHVLVLNRSSIEVEKGNFSSWWENKQRQDDFERSENDKLKKEIGKLQESAKRTAAWADKVENSKIGFDPVKESDRSIGTRSYLGEKSRRMQQRRKNLENRQQAAINEKSGLLKDIEEPVELKLMPLHHQKPIYIRAVDFGIAYEGNEVITGFNMELLRGDRVVLQGGNGSGKSSIIKAILTAPGAAVLNSMTKEMINTNRHQQGELEIVNGLKISYINQDTSHLHGSVDDYTEQMEVSNSLFKAILRQLDFDRIQFEKPMEDYSEGQKKKVLIAASLLQQAHLYIWDEPLNYIDIFTRMQIENLILQYQPTMLIVEHDQSFAYKIGTKLKYVSK